MKMMAKMKTRFLDRPVAKHLSAGMKRFLNRSGGFVRLTARRSLRKARKMKKSDLKPDQRRSYERQQRLFRQGRTNKKPYLPEATAEKGKPPRLHQKPKSLLRERLFYALAPNNRSVVIGPEKTKSDLSRLEREFPFMAPALAKAQPKIPGWMKAAFRK